MSTISMMFLIYGSKCVESVSMYRGRIFIIMLSCLMVSGCAAPTTRLVQLDIFEMNASIHRVSTDITLSGTLNEKNSICPREPVQMKVTVLGRPRFSSEKAVYLETWQGRDIQKGKGNLDFRDFVFSSPQGTFNENGWFLPNPNVLLTVKTGFQIEVALKKPRKEFVPIKLNFPPDYDCISSINARGQQGGSGISGKSGQDGGHGGHGGHAPNINVYATFVKTPYYDKLMAIKLIGGVTDFVLAPDDIMLTVDARGGQGGNGGNGGHGRDGRDGDDAYCTETKTKKDDGTLEVKETCYTETRGEDGSNGGNGGNGGESGNSGHVEFIFDQRFAELKHLIRANTAAVAGGRGGVGGVGGVGGKGGADLNNFRRSSGKNGNAGHSGYNGATGSAGTSSSRTADITEQFKGMLNIQSY